MKRSVKTLSLTIPRELYERVEALARRDGRSLSNYVGWVLGRHVLDTSRVEGPLVYSLVKPD
jgi:predicted DNA-binding protein